MRPARGLAPVPPLPLHGVPEPEGPLDEALRRGTRLSFFAVSLFLASQAFTVPLLPLGPSWSLWPTLTDLACVALVGAGLVEWRARRGMPPAARRCWRRFGWVVLVAGLSIVLHPLLFPLPGVRDAERWLNVPYGSYQLVRLVQCWVVFGVAARVPLDARRVRILQWVVGVAFAWTVVLVALTYLGVVRPGDFASQLPRNPAISGPWAHYRTSLREGLGTVGYNHGYVGLQVMALAGLLLVLGAGRGVLRPAFVLFAGLAACFLSGSRAAFVAWGLLCAAQMLRRPALLAVTLLALGLGASLAPSKVAEELGPAFERQSTVATSYQSDGLSGRDDIWRMRLEAFAEDPLRWVVGWGFGSAWVTGGNAHQQVLQLITEGGLFALGAFVALVVPVLLALWRGGPMSRRALWVTGAFLATALTQETFYPVPAFGYFLALYLCLLGLVLGPTQEVRQAEPPPQLAGPHAV